MQKTKRAPTVKKKTGRREHSPIKRTRNRIGMANSAALHPAPAVVSPVPSPLLWPLRILMVIDQFNIGGTETYTLSLTRELIRQGAFVAVAGKRGKLLDSFIGLGCPYYEIDFVQDNFEPDEENQIQHLNVLKMVIHAERIHIVHAHQTPSGELARKAAEHMNVPFVFTVHGCYYDGPAMEKLRSGTTFISVSPVVKRMLGLHGIESRLIPNGVDAAEYNAYNPTYQQYLRSKLGIPNHAFVVLYAGRLSWEKADICEEAIRTVAALRRSGNSPFILMIVGGGRDEKMVAEAAERERQLAGEPFIIFPGEVLNMRACYAISDCVIGTGRIALEAMACLRPLISVGSRGFLGIIDASKYDEAWDCWFGDHQSEQPLSRELLMADIQQIRQMGREEKSELVQSGRAFVTERFHVSQAASRMLDIYRQLVLPMM
ncbi:MAG: glycosyltransferase [Paenibacillus dendritiformis]|uniref:glycosyltransferase n=1 Tax=uncultured Paenibacillus sp. TaxID=227322 RepID=UPI0025F2CF94|nr:glycosyltransferase [uncultured Paenibacillus sp.]MDU5143917.1 glycosyltransferase [Paenibacillus dendritiformis]